MNETAWQPSDRNKNRAPTSMGVLVLIALVLVLIVLVVIQGILGRRQVFEQLSKATDAEAIPTVSVVMPEGSPSERIITLPGNVSAWYEAPIYAQVSGYLQKWYTDYGADVHRGQILGTVETPDLDEQLDQAKADLTVAQARLKLAKLTAARWKGLSGTQAVSQQQVDVYESDAEAQNATVMAQQHNVLRFEARANFKTLRAPFDGIVTARRTDIGDYVNASGGTDRQNTSGSELFRVADVHAMRIYVDVPQDYARFMKPGITATFTISQQPNRTYKAAFLTTAKAVTQNSRTVVTELTSDNADHSLWPGSYATVRFSVPTDPNILTVPSSSILFHAEGLLAYVVGPDNKIHVRRVTPGLDLGSRLQVTQGLNKGERLVQGPSEGLYEGEEVKVITAKPAAEAQKPKAS